MEETSFDELSLLVRYRKCLAEKTSADAETTESPTGQCMCARCVLDGYVIRSESSYNYNTHPTSV